jgi:transcriptional regulator with XRE-family HTH domain
MATSNPLSVGERIKARREELGLSLTQVAEKAGISKSSLHDLETRPNVRPSAESLYNIAEALDTTVGFLLGRRRHPMNEEAMIDIPIGLAEFARRAKLTQEDTKRLACIKYRDRAPKTAEDWEFVWLAIQRASQKIED